MEIRSAPLPPDLQYVLDGAIEHWEINAFTHDVLNLFGQAATIDRIFATEAKFSLHDRQQRCFELSRYAYAITEELGASWQRAFMASSISYEIRLVGEYAKIAADWNYEDETVGGCLQPFRKIWRCDDSCEPTKRLKRRLWSPEYIRRSVKQYIARDFPHAPKLTEFVRRLPWPRSLDEGEKIQRAREESLVRYRNLQQTVIAGMREPRKALAKPERRALTRAAALAASVVGEEKVRCFVAGHAVEIEGDAMILEAQPRGSLARHTGHGQLDIAIKRKDGELLGKLCVYFEKTAALDQLAALALHVGAGDEHEILSKGNLYAVTAAGAGDPLLSRFRREPPMIIEGKSRHAKQRRAQLRYFAHVGHHYVDTMYVQLWGRDAKRLRGYARVA